MRKSTGNWIGVCLVLLVFCVSAGAAQLEIDDQELSAEAKKWLKACRREKPDACFELGVALSQSNRHEDAVTVLSHALAAENAEALALLAGELSEVGRREEALVHWEAACDLEHAGSCLVLGDTREGEDRLDDAIDAWYRACRAGEVEGCSKRAFALRSALDITEAISAFSKLCLKQPEQCAYAGELLMVRGRLNKAAVAYLGSCTETETVGCLLPGQLQLLADDPAAAERAYETACDRGARVACAELAELRLRDGRTDKGLAAYARSCNSCEDSCVGWGDQLVELERIDEAVEAYGKACETDRCSHGCAAAAVLAEQRQDPSIAGSMLLIHCATVQGDWGVGPATASCHTGGIWSRENEDYHKAKEMFEIGCDAGDMRCCVELQGHMERDGSWYKDRSVAVQRCLDSGGGCIRGGLLQEASGDRRTAESMFRSSCDAGMSLGCWALADHLDRAGRAREARVVREQLGEDDATPEAEEAQFSSIERQTVATAAGVKSKLADLRGEHLTVLYMAEPWPWSYVSLSILGQLPSKYAEGEVTVVAVARPADENITDLLAEKGVGNSVAIRFAKPERILDALGAGEQQTLWVFDREGRGLPVSGDLGPGEDAALRAAIEAALGGP